MVSELFEVFAVHRNASLIPSSSPPPSDHVPYPEGIPFLTGYTSSIFMLMSRNSYLNEVLDSLKVVQLNFIYSLKF